jgi:aminopeptidase N
VNSHVISRYGFFIVAHQLRLRVGDQAYFRALDRLARRRMGSWITTEDLQAVMEETAGVDLSDFFDFWVHGGRVPEVTISVLQEVTEEGTKVTACVQSDQAFGSFDLPVRVTDQAGDRKVEALVDVDHGVGRFTVPARAEDVKVAADPDGQLLLYKRMVKQVKVLPEACAEL